MTFLDFCAGIGGFRLGLELAGHKCIGFCEKDKFAVKSYRAMFDTEGEWYADDVTKLRPEEIPRADIWCFGFPCQDISVAGKQRGIRGERSGIYFSIIDLIKGKEEKNKPTYLLIENVKNLLSINNGFDFATVLSELDQAGYDVVWQVLNSKDFGVPQNRERVFIIANLRTRGRREILPITGENTAALKQIIGGSQGYRVYDAEGVSCAIQSSAGGVGAKTGLYFIDQSNTKPQLTETSRCITSRYTAGVVNRTAMNSGVLEAYPILTPDREEKRQNGRRMKNADEPMFTLTSQDRHGVAIKNATKKGYIEANIGDGISLNFPNSTTRRGRVGKGVTGTLDTSCAVGTLDSNYRIRRLTPKECFRLQGFPDELFKKAKAVNSDAQLYKQAGNAVTVNVAFAVAKSLPESE
ncbi:DNA cytosine methyltransferase [Clostridium botulinum]|uniref:DNA cytosine methyltransferase n=1 Tax=Clostridium botulinum TaxID=1491 RepID=UPI000774D334|nr:DNA (cytosine-5-)-methyltransferase [Clostridium botulinum]NFL36800.1 DNA (cytosine-5-)-methyltransferase [Clostridium botulinum]NFL64520.1 DNA (cytosine-5-)-methyltransferase [Clostridium botulinum]NFN06646.1 DNA (cytosine-5-)-methyltransferase [Clostridium botulinum]NFN23510.1 DNA (cytosine-5-)-methyltransferase [Clostridium botulinum]NFN30204.1 DNA (cytosine-5-)-methyltransferase [Clostridium botulinum]